MRGRGQSDPRSGSQLSDPAARGASSVVPSVDGWELNTSSSSPPVFSSGTRELKARMRRPQRSRTTVSSSSLCPFSRTSHRSWRLKTIWSASRKRLLPSRPVSCLLSLSRISFSRFATAPSFPESSSSPMSNCTKPYALQVSPEF